MGYVHAPILFHFSLWGHALLRKSKNYKWLENLELDLTVEILQRSFLLGDARMIRKVILLGSTRDVDVALSLSMVLRSDRKASLS